MIKRQHQKPRTALAGAALIAAFVVAPALAEKTYEEKVERTEALTQTGRLYLSNISGRIDVMTWGEAQVKIEVVKTSRAATLEKAAENAAKVTVEVTKKDDLVRVLTQYPKRDSANVSVDYKVWVPDQAGVELKSISGDVRVCPLGGKARVNCISGDIELLGAAAADIESVSGDLTIENIGGDAYLKTVSGDIAAKGISGSVDVGTVSGDVELLGITGAQKVSAESVSGSIAYSGGVTSGGRYAITSHSGRVRMTIPAGAAFDLEASSFSGGIDNDFELQTAGEVSRREIRGTVGEGGATVVLRTFSGRIALKRE